MLRVSSACVTSAIVRQIFPLEAYQKKRKYAEVRSYIASGWRKSWKIWQALLLGQLLVLMLTEFSKSIVSEPRPHFWDTCKPNVTKEICDTGYCFVCFFVCFFFQTSFPLNFSWTIQCSQQVYNGFLMHLQFHQEPDP